MGRGGPRQSGTVGRHAENTAFQYLLERGLRPVARNFRRRGGEIDIIMLDEHCLVFIEVRYRRNKSFTQPGLTVDTRKQRKLVRTAALFIAMHGQGMSCASMSWPLRERTRRTGFAMRSVPMTRHSEPC